MAGDPGGPHLTILEGFAEPTLRLPRAEYLKLIAHCYDGLPDEACGLLAGRLRPGTLLPDGRVDVVYPTGNADASARTYSVDSRDLIRSLRAAEAEGLELVGVFHSHTHTEAWPSPTDVRQALEPTWLYVIVSLKDGDPVLRSFRITDGNIRETPVVLES
ncbi:MAG TPA: M67 family metallopeptidase [Acidimicrobiia bacterium]|nr:M67 family metallopeptidase [Acidimicrobiia bacterium]